ncbi:hypothetical protein [Corynebacterium casei]|uniref:hypothetical protein n=1 Tax=Corynebacterium casei TaxID=160386 RepID=UPI003F91D0F5
MNKVLSLTMQGEAWRGERVDYIDLYSLPQTDLSAYNGVMLSGGADQLFLETCFEQLSSFVRAGGKVLVNGHPKIRFIEGLPRHQKMAFSNPTDLWLTEISAHPMWEGIKREDLVFNYGVPGPHSLEDLIEKYGVAGFYSHAYLNKLPESTQVITGVGPYRLPTDISYCLGDGEVIVHNGNDLISFTKPGISTANFPTKIIDYLEGA